MRARIAIFAALSCASLVAFSLSMSCNDTGQCLRKSDCPSGYTCGAGSCVLEAVDSGQSDTPVVETDSATDSGGDGSEASDASDAGDATDSAADTAPADADGSATDAASDVSDSAPADATPDASDASDATPG